MKNAIQVEACLYGDEECWMVPQHNVAECIAMGLMPIDYHYHIHDRTETIVIARRQDNGYYFFRVQAVDGFTPMSSVF
jgi:hypothetical protein